MPLSFAETCNIPFASISKVTSIWGTPLGAGAISAAAQKLAEVLYAQNNQSGDASQAGSAYAHRSKWCHNIPALNILAYYKIFIMHKQ